MIQIFYLDVKHIFYPFPEKVFVLLKKFKNLRLEIKSYETNKKSVGKVTPTPMLQV